MCMKPFYCESFNWELSNFVPIRFTMLQFAKKLDIFKLHLEIEEMGS